LITSFPAAGNALALLIDTFYVQMLARIHCSRRQVDLELYLVESGPAAAPPVRRPVQVLRNAAWWCASPS
jgi:hypothetical protein